MLYLKYYTIILGSWFSIIIFGYLFSHYNCKKKVATFLEDMVWEIERRFENWVVTPWYQVKCGIQNLFSWFKIVWNDRDWDYAYLCLMMEFKMKRMSKHIGEENRFRHVNADKTAKQLIICSEIMRRIGEGDHGKHIAARSTHFGIKRNVSSALLDYKMEDSLSKKDMELFNKIFTRHLKSWWS